MAESKFYQAPWFTPIDMGDALVALPGQAATAAQPLGELISGAAPTFVPATELTAHAGGGQASAFQLPARVNQITTVGTAADSVKLPLAVSGLSVTVINASATSMQVFGSGTDTINGVATATGVAQAGGTTKTYYCVSAAPAGAWFG